MSTWIAALIAKCQQSSTRKEKGDHEHKDKHEHIPRSQEGCADIAVARMPAHWDTGVVHKVEASEEEHRRGCWEIEGMHSVLETAEKVVVRVETEHILKRTVAGVMPMVLEEAKALYIDCEMLALQCWKDGIDTVVAARMSAGQDAVKRIDFGEICACFLRRYDRAAVKMKCEGEER